MIYKRALISSEIKLSEKSELQNGDNPPVQVLRVGKFNHPKYGDFEITPTILAEMKRNFDAKIRGIDIAFDYFHKSDELASGWPVELLLTENNTELWAKMDWTPTARRMLTEREVRYFSPDFAFQWKDPESGVVYKNVLFGGGLTNRPFVKEMSAIVADEKETEMDLATLAKRVEDLEAKNLKLAEDVKAADKKLGEYADKADADAAAEEADDAAEDSVPALKAKLAEMGKQHGELKAAHEKLMAEMAESKKAKQLAEKNDAFRVLLSEGKAVPAQKEAYLAGDMPNFIKLAAKVNLDGVGHVDSSGNEVNDDRVLKLAEERVKAKTSPDLGTAISAVRKELGVNK